MRKLHVIKLIVALAIPLAVGGISAALSAKGMASYGDMEKPPLSPPAWVFSVAWTILYLMMGFAFYCVWVAEADTKKKTMALVLFGVQLVMNFMWSIVFFRWEFYLVAFVWLMIMWCMVILTAIRFFRINRLAGLMLIPYILWLTFAAYLNLGAYVLSHKA